MRAPALKTREFVIALSCSSVARTSEKRDMRRRGSAFTLLLLISGAASLAIVLLGGRSHGKATAASTAHPKVAADLIGDDISLASGDLDRGRQLFITTCASCHGATAQGLPHQGANLRASKF